MRISVGGPGISGTKPAVAAARAHPCHAWHLVDVPLAARRALGERICGMRVK